MKTIIQTLLILVAGLGLSFAVISGEVNHGGLEPVPKPPDLPDPMESGEAIEPEITIVPKEDKVVHEYRLNGRLYMVKVFPAAGKPYYLLDQDGDGRLESRIGDVYNDTIVPQWVLFTW